MIPLIEKKGLIIAIVFAFLAAVLFLAWMNQIQQGVSKEAAAKLKAMQENMVEAIYAKVDIAAGKVITQDIIYTKLMDKSRLPIGAAYSQSRVLDTIALAPIKKDSLVLNEQLKWPTTRDTTLSMKTPIGKRAISVAVDNISLLSGMIKPGDYVDVISLISIPMQVEGKQSAQAATVPLFQNILVLAVGSNISTVEERSYGARSRKGESDPKESKQEGTPLVTLALSPEEVNLLAFVQEQGKIRLVLRSPGDAKITPVQPASWETVLKYIFPNIDLNPPKPPEPEPKAKKEPEVEVIRGFKRELVPLKKD